MPGMEYGLRIEGDETQEVSYPRRTIDGINRFVIPLSANSGVKQRSDYTLKKRM